MTKEDIINKNTLKDVKKNIEEKTYYRWHLYAIKITKNDFVKKYLFIRNEGRCLWCGLNIVEKKVVHHIDYNHFCSFKGTILSNNKKSTLIPDCKNCAKLHYKKFIECTDKLLLVHPRCNMEIAQHHKIV